MDKISRKTLPAKRSSAPPPKTPRKKKTKRKSVWGMTLLGILLAVMLVSLTLCFMAYRMLTGGQTQEYRSPVAAGAARETATIRPRGADNDNTPVFTPGKKTDETVVVESINPEEEGIVLQPLPDENAGKPIDPTGRVSPPENVLDNLF